MSIETKAARKVGHDMLEAKIKTIESKLEMLKARAETAKAAAEIKAIAELASRRLQLRQKFEELRSSGDGNWEHVKEQLESLVAKFEKEVKDIEAKVHAH
jgi:5'-deoxynucleotidase YfbR-like HD superfamily hydrolase